jgi:hypothetical protein
MPSKITNLSTSDVFLPHIGRIAPGASVISPTNKYDHSPEVMQLEYNGYLDIDELMHLSYDETYEYQQQPNIGQGPGGINVTGVSSIEISGCVFHAGESDEPMINIAPPPAADPPPAASPYMAPPVRLPEPEPEPKPKGPKPDRWAIE